LSDVIFIDGNDFRAAELRQILPALQFTVEGLQAAFATSAPEPEQKARDKVLAHPVPAGGFAEASDLLTMAGKSLRLELDSENANRFCKWWRETPSKMEVRIALRRTADAAIEIFAATCVGRIADQPAGPLILGWDRLFVPDDGEYEGETLAEIAARGEVTPFRRALFTRVFA
jgi:Ham1 family